MSGARELGRSAVVSLLLVAVVCSGAAAGIGQASLAGGATSGTAQDVTSGTAQVDSGGAAIQNVTLEGPGYNESQYEMIDDHPGPAFVWQEEELRLNVTVASHNDSGSYDLCGRGFSESQNSSVSFDCEAVELSADSTRTVVLSTGSWPDNATGNHTVLLELSDPGLSDDQVVDQTTFQVRVIEKEGDLTGDGLTNAEEFEHGTDITTPDTDGDGLTDWEEVKTYGTNPLVRDTTGDGVNDATLVRLGLDPTEPYLLHRYVAAALLALIAIAWAGVLTVRRYRGEEASAGSDAPDADGADGAGADQPSTDGEAGEERPPIDESILTNEEVVCRLLDRNEGRMRQSEIIESTEWSKAKVSRVLSDLEEEGVVSRVRIGRENVVDLQSEDDDVELSNRRE
ncbi:helix-turn-helix transcriptional regulator [Halorubrum depositum]|uniref:helix-turn-helix transcriptional regulator n=1 Tax=Halorubrum depositum TaxID=2583992 RepID=UPI0011A4D540|nr:helix-turn-helix domain-containing protein [Halorubrum depositum]